MEEIDVFQKYGIDKENEVIKTSLTQENYLKQNHDSNIKENYQRLEFLGDKIIGLIIADYLYKSENNPEGVMTKEFQVLTSNSEHYKFSKYLRIR